MSTTIYVAQSGGVTGPHERAAVLEGITRGQVLASAKIAPTANGPWAAITSDPELAHALRETTAPARPQAPLAPLEPLEDNRYATRGVLDDARGITLLVMSAVNLIGEALINKAIAAETFAGHEPSWALTVRLLYVLFVVVLFVLYLRDAKRLGISWATLFVFGCFCGLFARAVYFYQRHKAGAALKFWHAAAADIATYAIIAVIALGGGSTHSTRESEPSDPKPAPSAPAPVEPAPPPPPEPIVVHEAGYRVAFFAGKSVPVRTTQTADDVETTTWSQGDHASWSVVRQLRPSLNDAGMHLSLTNIADESVKSGKSKGLQVEVLEKRWSPKGKPLALDVFMKLSAPGAPSIYMRERITWMPRALSVVVDIEDSRDALENDGVESFLDSLAEDHDAGPF